MRGLRVGVVTPLLAEIQRKPWLFTSQKPKFARGALRAPDFVENNGAEVEAEVWEV